jgi:hypothetical protein
MAYNYTEDGDILYYESTFYDERTNAWEIYESKIYYYPGLATAIASNTMKTESNDLILYPNPSSDIIHIQNFNGSGGQYTIYNMQGTIVKKGDVKNNGIHISGLKAGIYIMMVENKQQVYYGRFIKN